MKILITGGHLTPALGVIDEINNKHDIVFVGRKYAIDKERTVSLEYREIARRNIPFYHLPAGRFTRLPTLRSLSHVLKIPLGFYSALRIVKKERPDIILSFGGYIAFPICIAGYILKVPIFVHEQTMHPGLANRLTGFMAKKIFVSFPESQKYFPSAKVVVSGNPVRKSVLEIKKKPCKILKNKPVIYITGGALGSHSLNVHVEKILDKLLEKYIVIHQTGNVKEYGDYQRLKSKRESLPENKKNNYFLKEHFFADELGYIYSTADLVVGRSGANTFFELVAWKKPSILVPLPWAANNEQLKHAQLVQKAGAGEIFHQSEDSAKLLTLIEKVVKDKELYKQGFKNLENIYQKNAASFIVDSITQGV